MKPQPKPTKKKRKTKERTTLNNGLDREFKWYIRLRDGKCVTCGNTAAYIRTRGQYLNAGHYFSCTSRKTRWHPMNAHGQCPACNWLHENNPEPYRRFMIKTYGEKQLEELERLHNDRTGFTIEELKKMLLYWREQRKVLQGRNEWAQ